MHFLESISINISLEFVPEGRINNILALVQIMAWRRLGDKSLSEPMMLRLMTHICVTRPQWVKGSLSGMMLKITQDIRGIYSEIFDDIVFHVDLLYYGIIFDQYTPNVSYTFMLYWCNISWPSFLVLPIYQQSWNWPCRFSMFLSS